MEKSISAVEANRKFSEVLRMVKGGTSVLVTSHGKPVARIVPVSDEDGIREKAREVLFARLRKQRPLKAARWTRDELYDD